jgi:hypothetical protein
MWHHRLRRDYATPDHARGVVADQADGVRDPERCLCANDAVRVDARGYRRL